jgi:hypothetical protein
MPFGHEEPDVYRFSVRHMDWAYETATCSRGIDNDNSAERIDGPV